MGQNLDTIFCKTEITPCTITMINDVNVFYNYTIKNKEKSTFKSLKEIQRISLNKISDAQILILDTALISNIKNGIDLSNNYKPLDIKRSVENQKDSVITFEKHVENYLEIVYNDMKNLQINLEKCHNQYQIGTGFIVGGIVTSLVGGLSTMGGFNNNDNGALSVGVLLNIAGGISALAGTIIQIDSHKFIGRASISVEATGPSIKVNF